MVRNMDKIIKFFSDLYNKSIDINVYYTHLDGRMGFQHGNDVFINNEAGELDQELALVHEFNHVYQDAGFSISVPNIRDALVKDIELEEQIRRYEIDSRIVELLYAYHEFGDYGINLLKDRFYKGCSIFNPNIKECIDNLRECEVKYILQNDIQDAYTKAYSI